MDKELLRQMSFLGIRQADILENFVRSGGPGGQNVNKTSTCVYLKHIPTGIEVKCQRERSQALNRILARKILVQKIGNLLRKKFLEERAALEKVRRQKRKKPKRLKIKILEEKRRHSQKKLLRAKVRESE